VACYKKLLGFMFVADSQWLGLILALVSLACWGSWANTVKFAQTRNGVRFELVYWDYSIGCCLISLLCALTLGNIEYSADHETFFDNIYHGTWEHVLYALSAGVVFNIANLLLVAGIDLVGLVSCGLLSHMVTPFYQ